MVNDEEIKILPSSSPVTFVLAVGLVLTRRLVGITLELDISPPNFHQVEGFNF